MDKTPEQIERENELRQRLGEEIIPGDEKKPGDDEKKPEEGKVEDKKPEEEDKKPELEEPIKIIAEKKADDKKPGDDEKKPEDEAKELTEEQLLKVLSKKFGKEIKSLDDIVKPAAPTEEDKKKEEEKREGLKVAFGLQNGIITDKMYKGYIEAVSNQQQLVFEQYFAEQKENDPELKREEAEAEFEEKFGLKEPEDSRKFKRGQKEISLLAEQIIRTSFKPVFDLDAKFSDHENSVSSAEKEKKDFDEKLPAYTKDIQDVRAEVKKWKIPVSDKDTYEIDIDDEIIDVYVAQMQEPAYAAKMIKSGYDKEKIKSAISGAILFDHFNTILSEVIKKDRIKHQAGLKGVYPERKANERVIYNDVQKKEIEALAERLGTTVN